MPSPLAAITGASSGIGAEFARQLAAAGHDLLLIARRRPRLEELAAELARAHGVQAGVLEADLSLTEDIDRVADRLAAEPRLTLLVNNAGFGTKGRLWQTAVEDQARMHRVHMDATMRLTHAALRGMVERNRGGVINVSSVAGFARSQSNVSYCATKAWINAFTEGVHLELRGAGSQVRVQALCPGFTYSEFHDVMGMDRNVIPKWLWRSAEYVVRDSLGGLRAGKLFVVPGWPYKLLVAVLTKLPIGLRVRLEGASPHTRGRLEP
ncbi:MAG: SDR family oxidoreductase [Acidobacteria bacterium]|nr:SDR family oxidoreductase [Acidobacteriota bacterium]